MKKEFNINEMTDGILTSNISYVSKAITLVESTKHEHQEQAQQIINTIALAFACICLSACACACTCA